MLLVDEVDNRGVPQHSVTSKTSKLDQRKLLRLEGECRDKLATKSVT